MMFRNICAVFTHDIARKRFAFVHMQWFGNFCISWSMSVLVKLSKMTSESDEIWQFLGLKSPDISIGFRNILDEDDNLQYIIIITVIIRGGVDMSFVQPTTGCRRTDKIVSLERGVCSCWVHHSCRFLHAVALLEVGHRIVWERMRNVSGASQSAE
jgi:hypothetical protein